jgi:hypothetical protein
LFVIVNNCPAEPSKVKVPEFKVSLCLIVITVPIPNVPIPEPVGPV